MSKPVANAGKAEGRDPAQDSPATASGERVPAPRRIVRRSVAARKRPRVLPESALHHAERKEAPHPRTSSPHWGTMTKLVVTLTGVAIVGLLLVYLRAIVAPIAMAIVVAYLLQPFASFIERKTPLSWRMTVNLIYLVFVTLLIGLVTWGGVGLVQQIESLIGTIQTAITDLPDIITGLTGHVYRFGPFTLDSTKIDWAALGQQVLSYVQPAINRLGALVGTLAGSAVTTLGWIAFIVIVSYFFLAESGGLRGGIIQVDIPGYADDLRRLSDRLSHIWNAFLRGQIIIFIVSSLAYIAAFSILGIRFSIGLGLLTGFANFLPYIGPAISWLVLGLVTFFQGSNPFGLTPLIYTLISIGASVVIGQIFSNVIGTDIMAEALKVHPAYVLIAAIVFANLFGILGLIIAAPLLATIRLFGRYALRKLFERDPWPPEEESPPVTPKVSRYMKIRKWWSAVWKKRGGRLAQELPSEKR